MELLDKRNKAIQEIKNSGNKPTIDLVLEILDCELQMAREENDNASMDKVPLNQGGIAMCKKIKMFLEAQ